MFQTDFWEKLEEQWESGRTDDQGKVPDDQGKVPDDQGKVPDWIGTRFSKYSGRCLMGERLIGSFG
jgi:hypothetical protein